MRKILIAFTFFITIACAGFSQIIIDNGLYKASFNNSYRQSTYIRYYLYKGGGDCDREKFSFKNDDPRLLTATDADYIGSDYDKGHLANAEDFAFDCVKDELTFRYYNCLPQTPNLNRGVWKQYETLIRKWSQTEKLYIICGGFFGNVRTGNMAVPSYCWKIVQSVSSKKVLFCGWFKNSTKATLEEISVPELEKRLGANIILLK